MRFLTVAGGELRAAARRKGIRRLRGLTAAAFLAFLAWLAWVSDLYSNTSAAPTVFHIFSTIIYIYCLFTGAAVAADCISGEKREGTLGLLFLTNLNSAEIVAGKLLSNGLALIYSLLAIFPVLALLELVGGITFGEFGLTVLALANGLFFAIAAGFLASSVSRRQFPAIALATGLALAWGLALLGIAEILRKTGCPKTLADTLAACCPLHTLLVAFQVRRTGIPWDYWRSLAAVAGISCAWLAASAWWVGRTWRDRPKRARFWNRPEFGRRFRGRRSAARIALRRRLLKINPVFWLASRQRVSSPVFMVIIVVLVFVTETVTAPYFGRTFGTTPASALLGHLFAWVWTGLAIHGLVLYHGASAASQWLAEDRQTGALELVLCTSASERSLVRGLWLAYGRKMFFPALVAILVHWFFIWQVATVMIWEFNGRGMLPDDITPWRLIRGALSGKHQLDWQIGFTLEVLMALLVVLGANWLMVGCVGRWFGVRMKHPGFAPLATLTLAVVPPVLLFSLVVYLFGELKINELPEREYLPLLLWSGFSIAMGWCGLLALWAARRFRRDFRTAVTGRFEPVRMRRWWQPPGRRQLFRFASAVVALVLMLVGTLVVFYGYQSWKIRRDWASFQKQLKRDGVSLDLATILPAPVPDGQNFARTEIFQNLVNEKLAEGSARRLFRAADGSLDVQPYANIGTNALISWIHQGATSFDEPLARIIPNYTPGSIKDRKQAASAVWEGLRPLEADLTAARQASYLPFFQTGTNRNAAVVLQPDTRQFSAMERLHFLFALRASALVALDRSPEAGGDVLTSLRLARLARQSADENSSFRVQSFLVRSLQPIWDGLAEHRWSAPQLDAFQSELAQFNLLADHTNAIHRVALAWIENWRSPAAMKEAWPNLSPTADTGWQPVDWRFENCIELFQAAQQAMARVDAAAGQTMGNNVSLDLGDLHLDGSTTVLLEQNAWRGADPLMVSFAQNAVNQAIIACALERFRLATGAFPPSLNQLIPAYLARIPSDVVTGRLMLYQTTGNANYVLRGAGPDGMISVAAPSDDWVWAFATPTNAPPTPASGKR